MDFGRLTTPQRISAASILVTIVAAFLPWVSFLGLGALGIEGDGVITLVLALAGVLLLLLTSGLMGTGKFPVKGGQIALIVVAALTALIGLLDMNGAAAIGLYLTLFAGIGWTVGAVWQFNLTKQEAAGSDDAA